MRILYGRTYCHCVLPREPLIIPFLAFAAGILACRYGSFSAPELGIVFALFVSVALIAHVASRRLAWIPWTCCVCVAGMAVAEWRRPQAPPELEAEPGEALIVSGCVVGPVSVRDGRGKFLLEVADGARAGVSFRIYDGEPVQTVNYGTVVEFPARVRPPRNFGNPGAFDYAGYLARRQTYWTATVLAHEPIRTLAEHCGSPVLSRVFAARQTALTRLDALYARDSRLAGVMRALLLGDDDHLDVETSDEFRRTGTYHALVISGLHISLVAGSVLWLLRRVFAPLWLRLTAAGLVAWIYTLITAGDTPVLRAAVGFSLALIAAAVYRRAKVLNLLGTVAILFLAIDPSQLFEASFQLSFAAVAAIGALAIPIMDRTSGVLSEAARTMDRVRPSSRIPPAVSSLRVELRLLAQTLSAVLGLSDKWSTMWVRSGARIVAAATEMIVLSVVVQFTLLLPAIVFFHRVPLTGVAANLLAVPMLNLAVGFGLIGLVVNSAGASSVAATLVRLANATVSWFADLEPDWRSPDPGLGLSIAFVVSLCILAIVLRRKPRLWAAPALGSVLLAAWMCASERSQGHTGWLELSTIDVGQGDSILIVFPDGQTMLVDGGGSPVFKGSTARRLDIGEQVVSPYLWNRGLRRLDVAVMTHAHDDHAQGLEAIVRNFHPREFWTGAVPTGFSGTSMASQVRNSGSRWLQPHAGDVRRFGDAVVRVLAPAQEYVAGATARNNDSLVLELTYGKRRFVLTGDAERAVEAELAFGGALQHVDVLKVGHHGSKTSTTPDLLAALRPVFAVVSVGDGNLYNHPHPDVLTRLQEYGVQAFRTDRAGLTTFRTDGKRIVVETNSLNWRAD